MEVRCTVVVVVLAGRGIKFTYAVLYRTQTGFSPRRFRGPYIALLLNDRGFLYRISMMQTLKSSASAISCVLPSASKCLTGWGWG